MPMTSEQMIAFFSEQAAVFRKAAQAARDSSNYQLAALNIHQTFKDYLMAGLIQWRTGSESPAAFIGDAVHAVTDGLWVLSSFGNPFAGSEIPVEQASICAFLIGLEGPVCSGMVLNSDRRLDSIIADALLDKWEQPAWDSAMAELRAIKGSRLAVETYAAYHNLLFSRPKDASREDWVRSCEVLFKRRAKDGFYGGGDQTYGGGPDNNFIVDYRLAAILKKIGYDGESLHLWRWG